MSAWRLVVGLGCLIAAFPAFSLGLGDVQGRAVIGRPLRLEIPIVGSGDVQAQAQCVRLIPEGEDADLVPILLKLERRKLSLSSTRPIAQPVFRFRIRMGCPVFLEESYVILAEPPDAREGSARTGFDSSTPRRSERFTVNSATTLRLISRQRYPNNSSDRVRFIKRVAEANPEVFSSEARAFDQGLVAGTELHLPDDLPVQRSVHAGAGETRPADSAARRSTAAVAKPAPVPAKGKGRLVIGAGGPAVAPGPSAVELSESLDRLTEAMSEQVKVEIAMIERLKGLEIDLAEFKRQAAAERATIARIESELKRLREQADRDSTIKLALIILIGGMLCAIGLRWMLDRRSRQRWGSPDALHKSTPRSAAAHVSAPSRPTRATTRPVSDELDDLLPPR